MASSSVTQSSSSPTTQGITVNDPDVFQLIQNHQKVAKRLLPVEEVRTVLDYSVRGVLSTFSQKYQGYPSGSMVDFACDADGSPILAISNLAVHWKDLAANPKCSLLVTKDPEDRTDLTIVVHGDVVPVPDKEREAIRTAYLARHPEAFWVDFGDFEFMRIESKVVRFVSGVATALLGSGEFTPEEYKAAKVDPISQFAKPVASHMNKDHGEDTKAIVQHTTSIPVDSAYMLDLDSLGFNVKDVKSTSPVRGGKMVAAYRAADRWAADANGPPSFQPLHAGYKGDIFKLRIPFPRRAEDRKDVKTLVVEMLQAAKSRA